MPAPTLTGLSAAPRTGDRASASWVDLIEADGPVSGMPRMAALKAGAAAGPMAAALGEPVGPQFFLGTGGPSVAILPVTRLGTEILVNTATAGSQDTAQITSLSNGGFVVTWTDGSQTAPDTSSNAVRAQVFTAAGVMVGTEILVNTATANNQSASQITALSNGGFVVTWTDQSFTAPDTSSGAVRAQVFTAAGAMVGTEILVNTVTLSTQTAPQITALSNGGFVVTWTDNSGTAPDTSGNAVRAQVFTSAGAMVGTEILVNTVTANNQNSPQITALSNGGFVVTWVDGSFVAPDSSANAVRAQVFTAAGAMVGTEILVNTATDGNQGAPEITALSNGGFVVTWQDASATGGDTSGNAVRAQIFTAAGAMVGTEILVNTATGNNQNAPQVTALSNGGFVVTWLDGSLTAPDTSSGAVRAQVFTAAGAMVGTEILVNSTTANLQNGQQITALSDGGFVITWTDFSATAPDASGTAVRAQVFTAAGARVGTEILVNTATGGNQNARQITALSNGGFVVTWVDSSLTAPDTSGSAVRAQVFEVGLTAVEQVALSLKNRGFAVTDPDAGDVLSVTLSVDYGVLNVTVGTSGATVTSGNGTASVAISGTASQITALLNGNATSTVTYTANTDTPPASATVTLFANDGAGGTATTTAAITITDTFDAPPAATPNADTLSGTAGVDTIDGLAGDDIISGGTGNDTLNGNAGSDTANYATAAAGVIVRINRGDAFNDGDGGVDTLISIENATGSTFDDILVGDDGANVLNGGTGADTLVGLGGNDTLIGGTGAANQLYGGAGDDTYVVAAGDTLVELASEGTDLVQTTLASFSLGANLENLTYTGASAFIGTGNGENNIITGGVAGDTLYGLGGSDTLRGGTGSANTLIGGTGDDTYLLTATGDTVIELANEGTDTIQTDRTTYVLGTHFENLQYTGSSAFRGTGNAANNSLEGGSGNDVLIGRGGNDLLDGNSGIDTADYTAAASGVTASLFAGAASNDGDGGSDALSEIENLTGSGFADSLTGDAVANVLNGGAGNDLLAGRGGNDTLRGGAGIDTADYSGAAAGVTIKLALNTASNDGDGGSDSFNSIENIIASAFNDTLSGDAGANVINGGLGADFLYGLGGNDTLIGGTGAANTLQGGTGDDTYVLSANDTIVELASEGTDTIRTSRNFQPMAANVENLTFTGTGSFTGIGNAEANVIIGGAADDVLTGGLGGDYLLGLGGNDTLIGGEGAGNQLQGGLGDDTYVVDANDTVVEFNGEGTDTVQTTRTSFTQGDNVENLTFTGTGNFTGIGNALANVITGGGGDDTLTGGLGDDTLNGGGGTDHIVLAGVVDDYTVIDLGGGSYRIIDGVGGRDGTDTTTGVEQIRFSDGSVATLPSLAVPPPAPLEPVDKTGGAAQVLPGLGDDDFLPLAKDSDLPSVLPGAGDDMLVTGLERGPATGFALQLAPLDLDGPFVGGCDSMGGTHDRDGWLF